MFFEKTTYTIINEHKTHSSITICKFIADILQDTVVDVHMLIQETYDKVTKQYPHLSRRKQGDIVRLLLSREAASKPVFHIRLNKYL